MFSNATSSAQIGRAHETASSLSSLIIRRAPVGLIRGGGVRTSTTYDPHPRVWVASATALPYTLEFRRCALCRRMNEGMSIVSSEFTREQTRKQQSPYQVQQCPAWPSPYRFVRFNPRFDMVETLTMLKAEVNNHPHPVPVPWLDRYYALPSDFNLQKSELYQSARIYGHDVSSGASVAALLSDDHDVISPSQTNACSPGNDQLLRVLDLCCCPGLKLCAIADTLLMHGKAGEIVGVDISHSRISVCKRVLHKYQIQPSSHSDACKKHSIRIQVFCNDGTTFASLKDKDLSLVFDSVVGHDEVSHCGKRKRMNKSARARQEKQLKFSDRIFAGLVDNTDLESTSPGHMRLFDRVLVDAECSTDGSVVHIQKRACAAIRAGSESELSSQNPNSCKNSRWSHSEEFSELYELQRNLAASGFRLLRKGGNMVYSTCSLSEEENERVVQWLLTEFSDARIVPIDFFRESKKETPTCQNDLVRQGKIPGTVQFLPNFDCRACPIDYNRLFGGGFYLAKITKI
jgi:16S rRNA C967 or C1407 C5-methylase (RsmB/RsmF family)